MITRKRCPAATLLHDRHMVTGERTWRLVDPNGREIEVCSAACVVTWLCSVGVFADARELEEVAA